MEEPTNENSPLQPAPSLKSHDKRKLWFAITIFVVIAATAVALLLLTRNETQDATKRVAIEEATEDITVSIIDENISPSGNTPGGFSPATIKIKKGQSVKWVNNSGALHQIASDPHPAHDTLPGLFAPDPINSGDSYTFTFDQAGTYTYHDHLRPFDLKGTVIVE